MFMRTERKRRASKILTFGRRRPGSRKGSPLNPLVAIT